MSTNISVVITRFINIIIFNKSDESIKDIVDVLVTDAHGVSLFGTKVPNKECKNEVN